MIMSLSFSFILLYGVIVVHCNNTSQLHGLDDDSNTSISDEFYCPELIDSDSEWSSLDEEVGCPELLFSDDDGFFTDSEACDGDSATSPECSDLEHSYVLPRKFASAISSPEEDLHTIVPPRRRGSSKLVKLRKRPFDGPDSAARSPRTAACDSGRDHEIFGFHCETCEVPANSMESVAKTGAEEV